MEKGFDETDITVLLVTYNSNWDKVRRTLFSILAQKEVIFNIVVCDDGSSENNFDKISTYLSEKKFTNCTFVGNRENKGTIKNLISGLMRVKTKFVKPISPGDFFYDEYSLNRWLSFAKKTKAAACFGNAVYYSSEEKEIIIHKDLHNPIDFSPYIRKNKGHIKRQLLLHHDYILGAALLYRTQDFLEALSFAQDRIKYSEDIAATFYFVAKNKKIVYFYHKQKNIPVLFYEFGSGISTQNDSPMKYLKEGEKMILYLYQRRLISRYIYGYNYAKKGFFKKFLKVLLDPNRYFHDKFRISRKIRKVQFSYRTEQLARIFEN